MARRKISAHEKAKKHYLNLIAKAEKRLQKAEYYQNRLAKTNKLVEGIDINRSKEFLKSAKDYVESGKRFTKKRRKMMEAVQDRTHLDFYTSLIKYKETTTAKKGSISIPGQKETKVSDIEKLRRKYSKNRGKVTQEEFDRLTQFSNIMNPVKQAMAAKGMTMKSRHRDTSFGGNSQLLNDLEYSAGANPFGREMVEQVYNLMQNPIYFNAIETLYQTTDEGKDIKRQLDQAVGSDWYEEFKTAMQAIIQLIGMIKTNVNLSSDEEYSLGRLLERYEGESESYEKG